MKKLLPVLLTLLFCTVAALAQNGDTTPPTIVSISPAAGPVTNLSTVTVRFSEPVEGPASADLRLNGLDADDVSGEGDTWTYYFGQLGEGEIEVRWDPNTLIVDLVGNRFNQSASTWTYQFVDEVAPTAQTSPAAGSTVASLSQVEVTFSEGVQGVDAGDLRLNGNAATNLVISGLGKYVFQFATATPGQAALSWAGNHGITDFAHRRNAFGGGNFTVTVDPSFSPAGVRINEFLASNIAGLRDENNEEQDWIEIYNSTANPINLGGWSLSDDPEDPRKWVFPSTNIAAGQYLVVFASEKNRTRVGGSTVHLHTNFKLNPNGDYLALYGPDNPPEAVSSFGEQYPAQRNNYSYGYDTAGQLKYFLLPTPRAANGTSSIEGVLPVPHLNVQRGVYETPFQLIMSSPVAGAQIYYTTNGSEPALTNGFVYTSPITVSNTTIFRVAAFKDNVLPSASVTHTYIFFADVIRQSQNQPGLAPIFGVQSGTAYAADYEMDPEIVNKEMTRGRMMPAMKSLPVMSLVTRREHMFFTNGIYLRTLEKRPSPEVPASLEFILQDGTEGFQANVGVQPQGNASREPIKQPKHPLRISFKGDYGVAKLEYPLFPESPVDEFNRLVLRSDFNFSWTHWDGNQRLRGQRTRDAFVKDSMRAMGGLAGHNRYVHMFINGLYWGIYDPAEDLTSDWVASYLGGKDTEYDVVSEGRAVDGNMNRYNTMINMSGLDNMTNYARIQEYLDVQHYIDYMILHFYIGHQDWGLNKNWFTVAHTNGQFKYTPWDGENVMDATNPTYNRTSNTDVPSGLHTKLIANPEYRLLWADRAHKHMFNEGALTPQNATNRWMNRARQIDLAIIAETARWGDYRRDFHAYQTAPYVLYERDTYWLEEQNRLLNNWFPARTGNVLQQFRSAGLYPNVNAPSFRQHGGRVNSGYALTITNNQNGSTIYYTTNGTDPRVYGTGAISSDARPYTGAVSIGASTVVKARALSGTTWSALAEATFEVETLVPPIRIVEVMYNPIGGDSYEYIEIQNLGTYPFNIGRYSLSGMTYIFPPQTMLQPGQRVVLANNGSPNNWTNRYGITPFGYYGGSLANGGELLGLIDPLGKTIWSVTYDDENGWPTSPDGAGYSLQIIDPFGNPNDPANWQASHVQNGTPGEVNSISLAGDVIINEVAADNTNSVVNGGTYSDWVELRNISSGDVSLAGWSLSDGDNPRRFVFPEGTVLPAGEFLVVWMDALTNNPGLHAGFGLSKQGDSVLLYDAATNRADAVSFGAQLSDLTYSRFGLSWALGNPTPNAQNIAYILGNITNLFINEWLADPRPGETDWIELYNANDQPVSLAGTYLGTSNSIYQMQAGNFIPAKGYLQLFADGGPGPNQLNLRLPREGGSVSFYDAAGNLVNRVTYGAQVEGLTYGRFPDGASTIVSFVGTASPGAANFVINYNGPVFNEILAVNRTQYRDDTSGSPVVGDAFTGRSWVELRNPGSESFDLSGMAVGNGTTNWVFPSGSAISSGGYLVLLFDESQPGSTASGSPMHTGLSLSRNGGQLILYNSQLQPLDVVDYGLQAPNYSIGKTGATWELLTSPTPGQSNSAVAALGNASGLRINEWSSQPFEGDDWFEIFNTSQSPVLLSGLILSDTPASVSPNDTIIPPLSFIAPRGFARFVADGNRAAGAHHVNFSLDGLGEAIRLARTNELIDVIYFGPHQPGQSEGRVPDGGNFAQLFTKPSPGNFNQADLGIRINEILANTASPALQRNPVDTIELFNSTSTAVDISGWFLSDDASNLQKFQIPNGTILPAFTYWYADERQLGFSFNGAYGGAVFLSRSGPTGEPTGEVSWRNYIPAPNNLSQGFTTTCNQDYWTLLHSNTFGTFNSAPLPSGPIITEIMYNPPSSGTADNSQDEYIEISSNGGPLTGWQISGGVSFAFPDGFELAAGEYVILVGFDPMNASLQAAFRSKYGVPSTARILGPFQGRLNNAGETIEIVFLDEREVVSQPPSSQYQPVFTLDSIAYSTTAPWPLAGNGDGSSLQRAVAGGFGSNPANWTAGAPTPGRANIAVPVRAPEITWQTGNPGANGGAAILSVAVCGTDPIAYSWTLNGQTVVGANGASLTVTNYLGANAGPYRAIASNSAGSVTSAPMTIVTGAPVITSQPQSTSINAGNSLELAVVVSGGGPYTAQWFKDGQPIAGANGLVLSFSQTSTNDSGSYNVVVSNPVGSVTSSNAVLDVFRSIVISQQPQSASVRQGFSVTLRVTATGNGTLSYQWRFEGTNISGATLSNLVISSAGYPTNHGTYDVVITDTRGSLVSQPAFLTVNAPPVITTQPVASISARPGQPITLSVQVSGTPPFGYRWRKNGLTIPGENDSTLLLADPCAAAGNYTVVITNAANTVGVLSSASVVSVADTDSDGLDDCWEALYGFDPEQPSADADPDGDGLTNLQELLAGTNPTDAQSVLLANSLPAPPNGLFVEFTAMSNRTYSIQTRENLTTGSWSRLVNFPSRTTNRVERFRVGLTNDFRFFRVVTPSQ